MTRRYYRATRTFNDGSRIIRDIGAWSDGELTMIQENWRLSGWNVEVEEVAPNDQYHPWREPFSLESPYREFPEFTDDLDFFDAHDVIIVG